jgi:cysteine-rich repeat protein
LIAAIALVAACAKGSMLETSSGEGEGGASTGSGSGGSTGSVSASSASSTSSGDASSSSSSTSSSSSASSSSTSSASSSSSSSTSSSSSSASSASSSSSSGGPACGNGKKEGTEQCDGADVGGATCTSVVGAAATGTLGCTSTCTLDTSSCHWCGDGHLDPGEECDDANATNGDGCESCTVVCLAGYEWTNYHCYAESVDSLPWAQAKAECESAGGHLATISSAAEGDFIWSNVMDGFYNGTGARWIGGTDQAMEGTWAWTTGEPFSYTNWKSGEPNNSGGAENCLEYYYNSDNWNDNSCGTSHVHICEWDPPVAHP